MCGRQDGPKVTQRGQPKSILEPARGRLALGLLAAVLLCGGPALAQPRTQPQTAAVTPLVPRTLGVGLCQCIGDRTTIKQGCFGTPQECEAACASNHYAFVPQAQNCPR